MEGIIKASHIFNNVKIASKPHIYKVSLKSDMAIIQIDIQNSQNSSSTKKIINQSFNVESFIATIRGANINPDIPQYKNCWKWEHTMFSYCFQESRYIKYNELHKSEHHCYFGWCCKANFFVSTCPHDSIFLISLLILNIIFINHLIKYIEYVHRDQINISCRDSKITYYAFYAMLKTLIYIISKTNPPHLKTKQDEPCPHTFKCINYKGNHQADLYTCPFWHHCFNREQHSKKYQEIRENQNNSTHSDMNNAQA